MFAKSLLVVRALVIAVCLSLPTIADDGVLSDLNKELAEARQSLVDATERLRRVEEKICHHATRQSSKGASTVPISCGKCLEYRSTKLRRK